MRRGKPDIVAREIDNWMEIHGASIMKLDSVGDGWPDRCYGLRGHNMLVELKTGKNRRSDLQERRAREWRGDAIHLWRSVEDARETMRGMGMVA